MCSKIFSRQIITQLFTSPLRTPVPSWMTVYHVGACGSGEGCRESSLGEGSSSLRRRRRSPGRQAHGYVCWPSPRAAPTARCRSGIPTSQILWGLKGFWCNLRAAQPMSCTINWPPDRQGAFAAQNTGAGGLAGPLARIGPPCCSTGPGSRSGLRGTRAL